MNSERKPGVAGLFCGCLVDNNNLAVGVSLAARSPILVYFDWPKAKPTPLVTHITGRVIDPGKEEASIWNHAVSSGFVSC